MFHSALPPGWRSPTTGRLSQSDPDRLIYSYIHRFKFTIVSEYKDLQRFWLYEYLDIQEYMNIRIQVYKSEGIQ